MVTRRMFTYLLVIGTANVSFPSCVLAKHLSKRRGGDSSEASEILLVNGWICTREDLEGFTPEDLAQLRIHGNIN